VSLVFVLLLSCRPVDVGTPKDSPPVDTETADDSTGTLDTGPPPVASAQADPAMGEPPFTVTLSARGSVSFTGEMHGSWDLGDGNTLQGLEVLAPFGTGGRYEATLTVFDGAREASDGVTIYVRDENCPVGAEAVSWGTVEANQLYEISGVVQSRQDPQVLWVHNDRGDDPQFYALREDGRLLGTWLIAGEPKSDWEDIAIGREGDTHLLYLGDVGDNLGTREFIRIYRVVEPLVDTDPAEPVELEVEAETLILRYPGAQLPEGVAYNSETIMLDPRNQDLYVVTKDYSGATRIYRKPAPHAEGDFTLEHVLDLNFSAPPLGGGATTGGDISLDGSMIVVRTYNRDVWLWQRSETQSVGEAMATIPCRILLAVEPQSESIGFTTDGAGLISISEQQGSSVNYTALQ